MVDSIRDIQALFAAARRTEAAASEESSSEAREMRLNRQAAMSRTAAAGYGGSISMALDRPVDPMFYWRNSNLPYNVWEGPQLKRIREFCRIVALTHPIIGSVIDVFSTYPLVGMEMVCPKLAEMEEFYNDLFMNQLGYDEFLIDAGKEYWKVGEAFPLGSFNDLLGVWEADELLMPEDVKVVRSPFLKEPRFEMRLPANIRKIINERRPLLEYHQLMERYPELARYATVGDYFSFDDQSDDPRVWMPVSNMILSQIKHRADAFHERGLPIMLRSFRPLVQEEMLNAASDAISSRLYTPLILAKIGASATDLGISQPWIPTPADLDAFNEDMNAALAADFRLITHHFAVSVENVFGRESIPDLNTDFERLTDRMLQAFGMSRTMLSGGQAGETYAADAMNRDLLTQLLTTFQKRIKKFVHHRAAVVAEAQGHYDFEMKGGRAKPIMEEIIETDPDTGHKRIVRQPKLLIPELRIRSMNLKDEENWHTLIEDLRDKGVPISMRTRLTNMPIDLADEIEATKKEQVDAAVAAAETRRDTYLALLKANLPIPDDLKADFQPKVTVLGQPDQERSDTETGPVPTIGYTEPAPTVALVPTTEDIEQAQKAEEGGDGEEAQTFKLVPHNRARPDQDLMPPDDGQEHRPPESDEQRANMPKASTLMRFATVEDMNTEFERWWAANERHLETVSVLLDEDDDEYQKMPVLGSFPTRHVGHRDVNFWAFASKFTKSG